MMLRVAINGFGRIGRSAFKVAIEKHSDGIEIVGINDLTSPAVLAHLLKYDSAYGVWNHKVSSDENHIIIDQKPYTIYQEKEPAKLPWKDLNVDVVIESTGRFTDAEGMKQHLLAGAKKVVLSAPAKGGGVKTLLIGVNAQDYKGETLINNASCTTNCIAPVVDVMSNKFGIAKAYMTTIHAYTHDQNLQDGPHKDLRRARAAAANMIPTSTGAAVATTEVIPALKGLFDGMSLRVPIIVGSISDITLLLKKKVTVEEVNQALKEASKTPKVKGILAVTEDPIVSADIVGRSESSIVDLGLTQVVDGDLVKIFAWYDNEWGYSNRLIEQVINISSYGLTK
ncbi:MAG: type I glyceraldehyde-3-phosphate dehydrogenase [Candidatus Daviesbacteria bacterium]|nr:type I glyceraldehyde-3-phosphate dehydrogenase [Candidatus Daviesbacteria bacterium]